MKPLPNQQATTHCQHGPLDPWRVVLKLDQLPGIGRPCCKCAIKHVLLSLSFGLFTITSYMYSLGHLDYLFDKPFNLYPVTSSLYIPLSHSHPLWVLEPVDRPGVKPGPRSGHSLQDLVGDLLEESVPPTCSTIQDRCHQGLEYVISVLFHRFRGLVTHSLSR